MSSNQQFVLKLASLLLGVGLIVAAFLLPGLDSATRLLIAAGGGGLAGLPLTFPGAKPPAGPVVLLLALGLSPAATGCSQPKPPCDSGTASAMASACALRVQVECVQKGIPQEECTVIDECDRAAHERTQKCGG